MTVVRDGRAVLQRAWGTTIDGAPATSDSPMVVASVGKLLTALMIARLDEAGAIDVDAPMPWTDIGVPTHPGWADVTLRELLAHTSGMADRAASLVRRRCRLCRVPAIAARPSALGHAWRMDLLERQLLRPRPPRRTGHRSPPRRRGPGTAVRCSRGDRCPPHDGRPTPHRRRVPPRRRSAVTPRRRRRLHRVDGRPDRGAGRR